MSEKVLDVHLMQNPTLEHYTSYKASELKSIVLALEDLQLNTSGCSLNAIREKYRQQKVIICCLGLHEKVYFSQTVVELLIHHSSCLHLPMLVKVHQKFVCSLLRKS
jgi:hypothetical protein